MRSCGDAKPPVLNSCLSYNVGGQRYTTCWCDQKDMNNKVHCNHCYNPVDKWEQPTPTNGKLCEWLKETPPPKPTTTTSKPGLPPCWCPTCPSCSPHEEMYCEPYPCDSCGDRYEKQFRVKDHQVPRCTNCSGVCLACKEKYYPACRPLRKSVQQPITIYGIL